MEYKNIRSGGGNQRDDKIKSFPYFEKKWTKQFIC